MIAAPAGDGPAPRPPDRSTRATAVLLAGGSGTRMGRRGNKVYTRAGGRPLLAWSLAVFERCAAVDDIVLVVRNVDRPEVEALLAEHPASKVSRLVNGGATRHDSEQAALDALAADVAEGRTDVILVHDAARPFVREELVTTVVEAAARVGGAIPGLRPDRPVYRISADGRAQPVGTTHLRRVQTPQAFKARPLLRAYDAARRDGFRGLDTADSVQRYTDVRIAVVPGDPRNIKVTFARDLETAQALAADLSP